MIEKIKVNLSYTVYNLLIKDMENFRFHFDEGSPNKNLFYNTVVKNMMEKRKKESLLIRDKLTGILDQHIKSDNLLNNILEQLEDLYNYRIEDKTNRSHGYYISFRPSKSLMEMYEEIEAFELKSNTISNYYRNIFNDYSKLAQDERERIVFSDTVKTIESSIKNKKIMHIKLNKASFDFIPYALVRTEDQLYNYTIGAVRRNDKLHPFSLHLYKCENSIKTKNSYTLTDEEKKYFDKLLVYGPREIERRTVKTIIRLTPKGIRLFNSNYVNRPIPAEIKENIYTFNCSQDNLFFYFSRFGSEAEILEPENLRNQIISFHRRAYNSYINNSKKNK